MEAWEAFLLTTYTFHSLFLYWGHEQFMHIKTRTEEVATKQEELVVFRDQLIAFEQTCAMVSLAKREMQYF